MRDRLERGSAGLCLIVDEVQAQQPEPAAVMFAAGLPNTPDVLTAAVTFSERFALRTLHRLEDRAAREVLEQPCLQQDVSSEEQLIAMAGRAEDDAPVRRRDMGDGGLDRAAYVMSAGLHHGADSDLSEHRESTPPGCL